MADEHTTGPWQPYSLENDTWAVGNQNIVPPFAWAIREADARLIAAAPDLLAALERILAVEPEWGAEATELRDIARAAIARAKEES